MSPYMTNPHHAQQQMRNKSDTNYILDQEIIGTPPFLFEWSMTSLENEVLIKKEKALREHPLYSRDDTSKSTSENHIRCGTKIHNDDALGQP